MKRGCNAFLGTAARRDPGMDRMNAAFAYDVCVVGGCGRVGLPLSLAFAGRGRRVLIQDVNDAALRQVRAGAMPFKEKGAEELLRETLQRTLFLSADPDDCREARFVVITIGTPVREDATPDVDLVRDFIAGLLPRLRDGQILILRSTVYPGTTDACRRVVEDSGKDIGIAFCPERISEGNSLEELFRLPQIVSGYARQSVDAAGELFKILAPSLVELTPREAELAKLFSNAYRYLHFSIANQFHMLAGEHGADFGKIRDALTRDYPRNRAFPRPGFVGGPCLFKDTAYLAHCFPGFDLGRDAIRVNRGFPEFVAHTLAQGETLAGKTVGVLGMAFKPGSDDLRDSPALDLVARLRPLCEELMCSDEYAESYSGMSAEELIRRCDVIVIGCAHARYRTLDFGIKKVFDPMGMLAT